MKRRISWLLWTLCAAALHLFGNSAWTLAVLVSSVSAPALCGAALWAAARLTRFGARFSLPDLCEAGGEIEGFVALNGRLGRFSFVRCQITCENPHSGEKTRQTLRFGADSRAFFALRPLLTGSVNITAEHFRASDPLGLFSVRLKCAAEHVLTVPPGGFFADAVHDETPDSVADNDEYSMTRPGADTSEIYAVREYVPGDPVRAIHWKLTEKLGKTMVREFGRPLARRGDAHPDLNAAQSAEKSATDGQCLCEPRDARVKTRAAALILAAVLFVCMAGALAGMLGLERGLPRAELSPRALADGFKLLCNRLFAASEQRQAYRYQMYDVQAPNELHDGLELAAFALFCVPLAAASALAVRRKGVCAAMFALFIGTQIYFGVFAAPVWGIALCFATAAALGGFAREGANIKAFAPIAAAAALTLALTALFYGGPSVALSGLSETIRDRFDEKIERPISQALDPQSALSREQTQTTLLREQKANVSAGGQALQAENEPRFSGSRIGAATAQRLWVLWLISAAFGAAFAVWVAVRLARAAQLKKSFDSDVCAHAIDCMFRCAVRRLTAFGLVPPLTEPPCGEFAAQFNAAAELWREAVFSDHKMTSADRARMRVFLRDAAAQAAASANFFKRICIGMRIIFADGGAR